MQGVTRNCRIVSGEEKHGHAEPVTRACLTFLPASANIKPASQKKKDQRQTGPLWREAWLWQILFSHPSLDKKWMLEPSLTNFPPFPCEPFSSSHKGKAGVKSFVRKGMELKKWPTTQAPSPAITCAPATSSSSCPFPETRFTRWSDAANCPHQTSTFRQ